MFALSILAEQRLPFAGLDAEKQRKAKGEVKVPDLSETPGNSGVVLSF